MTQPKSRVFMVVSGNIRDETVEISTFVRTQAESLQHGGWEVRFGFVDNRTSVSGIFRNLQRLKGEAAQAEPGLVHAQYGSVTAALAALIRRQLPLVVSFCGDDLLGTPNLGLTWRIRERCARIVGLSAAWQAAAIIVKSNNLLRSLPARLHCKAYVLPNGVDTNWFIPMDRNESRARLGWKANSKVVLFHASHSDNQNSKNLPLARATVEVLARSIPDVSLYTLSNTSAEEVRLIMNAADCLLVTSLHEGSPNIVKEAMACNLPVVSVPCGDVTERINAVYPGAIRPYDAFSLAKAIQEVISLDCRSNGREQLLAQGLTTEKIADRLIQIYCQIQKKFVDDEQVQIEACVE